MNRSVVTAMGMVTAAGTGRAGFGAALEKGALLSAPATMLDASRFPEPNACEVPGLDPKKLARTPKDAKILARASVLALGALADLIAQHSAESLVGDPWRSGLFLGVGLEQGEHRDLMPMLAASRNGARLLLTKIASDGVGAMNPLSSLKTLPNMSLAHVGIKMGEHAPRGPNAAYSPFDASGIEALAAATAAVRSGECEMAIAGAVDAPVSLFGMTTFHRIGVTSFERPLGEAAVLFVVETPERAAKAGRTPLAEIEGWGSASDGCEPGTTSAATLAGSINEVFSWTGLRPDSVDRACLSAGDTATHAEALAASGVAGVPVDVVRRVFGETVAAGGAVAAAAAIHRIGSGSKRVLVSSGAFGGACASMLFRRFE